MLIIGFTIGINPMSEYATPNDMQITMMVESSASNNESVNE